VLSFVSSSGADRECREILFIFAYKETFMFMRDIYFEQYIQGKKATGNLYLRAFCIFSVAFNLPFHSNTMRRLHAIL